MDLLSERRVAPFVLNLADEANRRSTPRISRTHERGDCSMSRFDRRRCQSTGVSCKTLAPEGTRTKTQAEKK
jgi:hypothetical protein